MRIIRSESFNSCFLDFLDKHSNRVAPVMDKLGFFEEVLERDGPMESESPVYWKSCMVRTLTALR